jgi:hypothetical protein
MSEKSEKSLVYLVIPFLRAGMLRTQFALAPMCNEANFASII